MSHGFRILVLAAGLILTCIVCVIALAQTKKGQSYSAMGLEQISTENGYQQQLDLEGQILDGAAVIDLMKQSEGKEVYFLVKTKACSAIRGVFYNRDDEMSAAGSYDETQSPLNEDYIKESACFSCEVIQNENQVVVGMRFVQQ